MDRNLGASQTATSSTDAASFGSLYQWGRGTDGHQCRNSGTTTTLSSTDQPGNGNYILISNFPFDWRSPKNDNLWQGFLGENNPCPGGFRVPTSAEWDAERLTWTSNNSTGALSSALKLPMSGYRNFVTGAIEVNVGHYWTSTVNGDSSNYLHFHSGAAYMDYFYRAAGFSVRCIKEQD